MLESSVMEENLKKIKDEYLEKIKNSDSLKELDQLFLELFGKSGVLTLFPKEFPNLSKDELKVVAPFFNKTKVELEEAVEKKRQEVREEGYRKLQNEKLEFEISHTTDAYLRKEEGKGYLHPLTQFQNQIVDLFSKLGFFVFEAPHIESDHYNFEVLNIPEGHPARDLWDTLYIESGIKNQELGEEKLLLRTHTSNAQIRLMEQLKPPFRAVVLDWCFRKENLDARHEHTFDQFEVVMVEEGLNMGHLQFLSEYFFKEVLGEDTKVRLRPKYYPFVEPGAGVDATCLFCKGKGCKTCGGVGWFELAGAGMVHPTVLKNGGIDPEKYSGIAWGVGLGRMLMLKHGIEDVRLFNSGDLNFIQKIGEAK